VWAMTYSDVCVCVTTHSDVCNEYVGHARVLFWWER